MKRTIQSVAAIAVSMLLAISTAFGHGHGGGGGGGHGGGGFGGGHGGGFGGGHAGGFGGGGFHGGGFSGGHMGGFSGGHMGGFSGGHIGGLSGGGIRMGGTPLGGFGGAGGVRSAPSIGSLHSPSMGSIRSAPGIGSLHSPSLGSVRSTPGIGSLHGPSNLGAGNLGAGNLRLSPNISGLGASGLNHGLSANRGGTGSLSRATVGNVRPNIGTLGGHAGTALNGHTWNGNSIGNRSNTLGNRTALGGLGQTGLRLNNGTNAHTNLRPNLGNVSASSRTGGAVHSPVAGRVTPQNLNSFLSINNGRNGVGGRGGLNVSHVGGANIHHNFNHLNTTQIHNINNNLHNGFHHHHGFNNRGFGFNTFGFGFGSPYWNNWGLGVRGFWNPYGYYGLFGSRFWATNYCYFPWRRSYYYWGGYPYSYWWNYPTWGGLTNWFPYYNWSTPYYYGYGPGGNIVYNGGTVYMNDVPIATAADYAASAAALAAVPEPANPDATTEWMPLGTFALSENEADKDPSRVVQLAVDKDGIVSGTMHNKTTNQTFPIQGRVDKETQRVAFTIGDAKDVVFETGIYNLTQQQTPVLVHGDGREETYLLLRLELPKDGAAAPAAGVTAPAGTPAPPAPGDSGIIAPTPPGPTAR